MAEEIIQISRKDYDELCHQIRNLTAKAEGIAKRSEKINGLIGNMSDELEYGRGILVDQIKKLERLLENLRICEMEDE